MVRRLFGVIATVALACGAMVAFVGPAQAGEQDLPLLTITVHKEISGTPDGDQTYQVRVQCVHDDAQFFGQTKNISWSAFDGTFDPSDANAVFEIDTRADGSSDDITCTVLEVGTAGAASHTIECTGDSGDAECIDPDQVIIDYAGFGDADLTVTNVYPDPVVPVPPAPPVPLAAAARFTG